jgi:hypothetical protein
MNVLRREAVENCLDVTALLQYFTHLAQGDFFTEWKLYHS